MLNTPQFPEGFYEYTVYEQTSASNLDPTDSSVVGVIEEGMAFVRDSVVAFGEETYTEYTNTEQTYVYVQD